MKIIVELTGIRVSQVITEAAKALGLTADDNPKIVLDTAGLGDKLSAAAQSRIKIMFEDFLGRFGHALLFGIIGDYVNNLRGIKTEWGKEAIEAGLKASEEYFNEALKKVGGELLQ